MRTLPLVALFLTACADETFSNAGTLIVEPQGCDACSEPPWCAPAGCAQGGYPEGQAFRIWVYVEGEDESRIRDVECDIVQSGEYEITVSSSWVREWRRNEPAGGHGLTVDCGSSPELGPGPWVIKYGEGAGELEIPNTGSMLTVWDGGASLTPMYD